MCEGMSTYIFYLPANANAEKTFHYLFKVHLFIRNLPAYLGCILTGCKWMYGDDIEQLTFTDNICIYFCSRMPFHNSYLL